MIEFGILGPLEARRDGAEITLGGHHQRAVLALLLLDAGRIVSIDRIAEELYTGDTPVSAVTQVHRQISELRRALGEQGDQPSRAVIETRAPGYLINIEPEDARVGMRVEVYFERVSDEAALPLFMPVAE